MLRSNTKIEIEMPMADSIGEHNRPNRTCEIKFSFCYSQDFQFECPVSHPPISCKLYRTHPLGGRTTPLRITRVLELLLLNEQRSEILFLGIRGLSQESVRSEILKTF